MNTLLTQESADLPHDGVALEKKAQQPAARTRHREPRRASPSSHCQPRSAPSSAPLPPPPEAAPPTPTEGGAKASPPAPALNDPVVIAALNRQAAVLENVFFPAQVLASLKLDDTASISAVRLFLARFREEAGAPQDPVEKLLLDQLVVAHLKVGELYAQAAGATRLEFKQLYGNAAARLLGAVCQLVSTLAGYRASARPGRREIRGQDPEGAGGPGPEEKGSGPAAGQEKQHTQVKSKGRRSRR